MKNLKVLGLCAAAALLLAATPVPAQPAIPSASATLKLTRVVLALPAGAEWLSLHIDPLLCIYNSRTVSWSGERQAQPVSLYAVPFKKELESAGYKTTSSDDNLFGEETHETGASDYQVGAVITDAHVEGCMSNGAYFTESGSVRGSGSMKVEWQVYSPLKKQVVARITTSGEAKLEKSVVGGVPRLVVEAFGTNVRALAANAEFRAAVAAAPISMASGPLLPGQQTRITLAGSLKAVKRPIADTVGSVVTILTGSGSGSGDLVSSDGYMLTNAHVVGDEKQVRVRWSDGIETVADVIRVAKNRDIALIKTSSRDREPLPLKRGPVSPAQRVYAIGSPRGQAYQGTVSSGIVSAVRTVEGLRYIQSDVAISHGSSGGALLDENGAVIGITVSGVEPDVATGLHFFIPIGDAMDFLNLDQQ